MAKAYDYVITLRQPNFYLFNWVNHLLVIMSVLVFGYTAYHYPATRIFFIVVAAATLGYWLYCLLQTRRPGEEVYYRLALVLASIGWFHKQVDNLWVGGLLLLVAFLERQVKFPQEIGFSEEGVTLNTFPKKQFRWADLSNAVLKDGLITLDFRNNRLLQKEVETDVDETLEKEFNHFCQQRLAATHSRAPHT